MAAWIELDRTAFHFDTEAMNRPLAVALILSALIAGFLVRGWVAASALERHSEQEHDEHEHDEEPHVDLSKEAFETLRLRLEPVQIAAFEKTITLPAEVAEFPGVSASKLAAPVDGVVTAIAAEPGATTAAGEALFEIQITDERVLDAQLQLLESLTRLQIVQEELDRLRPLAASGAVSGRQRRDLDYEGRELETTIRLRRDELIVRGLPEDQVDALVDQKQMIKRLLVRVPNRSSSLAGDTRSDSSRSIVKAVAWKEAGVVDDFSIESLLVQPGQTVKRGEALCDLASHARLYLRVQAFERDVPLLAKLSESGTPVSAEFGHSLESHGPTSTVVPGLQVRYVANHVETDSQAYACYIPLANELLNESTGPTGRRYRTWRFSVGQRAHVLLPIEQIMGQIPLPVGAVAIEGADAFVFVPHEEHDHEDADESHEEDEQDDHDSHDDHDHEEEHEAFVTLEPLPVTVLYRDARTVVVAADGELKPGDTIAMNAAYQLRLAVQAEAEGGGGHGHDHGHAH